MSRRDRLKSLLEGEPEITAEQGAPPVQPPAPRPRSASLRVKTGPILHLASDLRADSGEPVLEIEAALIDASFIKDRLDGFDAEQDDLASSIREHGQQVPVLLRPHPENAARYQVVYGHRRVKACLALGRPVRAVVKSLTDAQLVVAQGQENSARRALSYIERAFFALRLSDGGFERDVIMAALSLSKSHLSTLLSVGRRIPAVLIERIGPAPKAGEPRWSALADRLDVVGVEAAMAIVDAPAFQAADSDARFTTLFNGLQRKSARGGGAAQCFSADGERPLAVFREAGKKASLTVDEKAAPAFGRFLFERLPELYQDFLNSREPAAE